MKATTCVHLAQNVIPAAAPTLRRGMSSKHILPPPRYQGEKLQDAWFFGADVKSNPNKATISPKIFVCLGSEPSAASVWKLQWKQGSLKWSPGSLIKGDWAAFKGAGALMQKTFKGALASIPSALKGS